MAKTPAPTPADHVAAYLTYLEDATSLIDETAVTKAQKLVDNARTPIDRVLALSDLERARTVDGDALRAGFIEHAAQWAADSGATVGALSELVSHDDLVDAGLIDARTNGHRRTTKTRARRVAAPERTRAPSLSTEEIVPCLPTDGAFTLNDMATAIDRQPATTRNYLNTMLADGTVVEVGDDPNHTGKGRAPKLYQLA